MATTIEVRVPDIGDFKDVPVIEVLVKAGDTVKAEDALITLESDKATMDVPSPAAGTVAELKVKAGDKLSEGSLILTLTTADAGAAAPAPQAAAPSPQPAAGGAGAGSRDAAGAGRRPQATRPRRLPPPRRPTQAAPTSNAKCSCWARGPAATPLRSARPTSA